MSALTVGVNSSETLWEVDAVPDPEFGYYTVGSEIVRVIAGFPASTGYAHGEVFPAKIRVSRGTNGSTAASHLSGAALTAANAFSGGGATPTLAEVLAEGNDPEGATITTAAGAFLSFQGDRGILQAASGAPGGAGQQAMLLAGDGDDGNTFGGQVIARPGTQSAHGKIQIQTDNSNGPGALVSDGSYVTFSLAAFVANGSTVDQLRDALIAAGLMAAS